MNLNAPRERRVARRGRPAAAAIATVVVAILALSGTTRLASPADGLRVLAAPEASAAPLAGKPGAPPTTTFDYGSSRRFTTPDGSGYVLTSRDRRTICLVVPDGGAPGTYGSGCTPVAMAEREGIAGEMIRPARGGQDGRTLLAFVLPAGASNAVRVTTIDGKDVGARVEHGVVVVITGEAATLRYRVRGHDHTREIPAPFAETADALVACGRRTVRVKLDPPPPDGSAPQHLATARYCR